MTARQRAVAWSVHLFAGLGLVAAAGIAVLIVRGGDDSFRAAFGLPRYPPVAVLLGEWAFARLQGHLWGQHDLRRRAVQHEIDLMRERALDPIQQQHVVAAHHGQAADPRPLGRIGARALDLD